MIQAFRRLLRLEQPQSELESANILDFPGPRLAEPEPEPEPEIFPDIVAMGDIEREELSDSDSQNSENNDENWSNEMSQHDNDCHDHRKKYVCFNPPARAQVGTYYEFDSYCCDDDISQAAQDFYDFAILKKGANPAIKKVELVNSPNGASKFVIIHWRFIVLVALILADAEELWEKYLDLLGY